MTVINYKDFFLYNSLEKLLSSFRGLTSQSLTAVPYNLFPGKLLGRLNRSWFSGKLFIMKTRSLALIYEIWILFPS